MVIAPYYRDFDLPWEGDPESSARFRKILRVLLIIFVVLGIAFPLLADPDRAVGRAYGIVGPLGFYRRAVVDIDGGGIVRHARRTLGYAYPSSESVLNATREALVPA